MNNYAAVIQVWNIPDRLNLSIYILKRLRQQQITKTIIISQINKVSTS